MKQRYDFENSFSEYVPKKKRKKTGLLVFLLLFVLLLGAAAFLILPITSLVNPLENTFDALFFDTDTFESLLNTYEKKGVHVEAEATLPGDLWPQEITLKLDSLTVGKKDAAKTQTEITLSSEDAAASYTVYADDNFIALAGLQKDSEKYVSLPRKDVEDAAKNSIFHYQSTSKYKVDTKADYAELVDFLKLLSTDEQEREDVAIDASIERILKATDDLIKPKNEIGFDEDRFALVRTVTYTLDEKDIARVLNIVKKEAEENKVFDALYTYTDEKGNEKQLADYCEKLKETLSNAEIVFAVRLESGRITDLHWQITYASSKVATVKTDLKIAFLYGEDDLGFDLKIITEEDGQALDLEDTYKITYRKKNNSDDKTTATLKISGKHLLNNKKHPTKSEEDIEVTFVYKSNGDWSFKTDGGADSVPFELNGNLTIDKKKSRLDFTLGGIFIGNVGIKADLITLCTKKPAVWDTVSTPKHTNLLEMKEREFEKFYQTIYLQPAIDVLEDLCNEKVFGNERFLVGNDSFVIKNTPLTVEGAPIIGNYDEYKWEVVRYYQAYKETGWTRKVYFYYENLGVYMLIEKGSVSFTYEMTNDQKQLYTLVVITSNGSMRLPNTAK